MIIEIQRERFLQRLFVALLSFELGLVFFDLTFEFFRLSEIRAIRRIFNMAREGSFPSWFSSTQLIVVGLVIFAVAYLAKEKRKSWAVIGAFFVFMGIDDAIRLHERLGTAIKELTTDQELVSYSWQIYLGPFFAAMGFYIFWFLWRELKEKRSKLLIFAALSTYATAMALDFVEGMDINFYENIGQAVNLRAHKVSHLFKVTEEFLEIFGTTLFLMVFLRVLLGRLMDRPIKIHVKA